MNSAQGQFADQAGRYHLDSVIATGGMGVVWRGTDTRLNRSVAVKVLKPEYADDPMFRTRFEAEARSAAALHHPGIAGVYDYGAGEVSGNMPPYLVMELVDGQPLSNLLATARGNDRTLDTAVVQDLIAQTGEALAVAHRAGTVHRDVKPANLLITADRRVKITDFGIARAADAVALTRTGSVMGTPQYLSPEQARGNPSTPASDVYSLGVVAFECLTGRRPFDAETPVATALAHLQQPVPALPSTVPPALAAIVTRALSKDPADRYPDGAAFAAAVRGADLGAGPVPGAFPPPSEGSTQVLPSVTGPIPPATPTHTPMPVPVPAQPIQRLDAPGAYAGSPENQREGRSPWPVAIAVILLVIAAVVVAALLLGRDRDDDPAADDTTSDVTSEATTESSSSEPTETTETTPEATTVQVDDTPYSCTADYRDAVADLQDDGLQVTWEQDSTVNDGTCPADTVSRFSTNGTLNEGDPITVYYWGPVVEPSEETSPTDETTDPSNPLTELPGGEDG
ncbi:serine/threonine-protein kinase [Nocardioides sp. CPCC 206347]|uniref:serine/threonine-protein kinase n=1 Tax=unclassified Nocardioides TaxID=2615069 RepID=UPI00360FBAC4